MDLILFDDNMHEVDRIYCDIDAEYGAKGSNDFELSAYYPIGHGVYVPGTEIGGIIEQTVTSGYPPVTAPSGWLWRGLLSQAIISPPTGADYLVVSGDAHTIMKNMLSGVLGGFFKVPESASGCVINNYQFDRYTTVLDGLNGMLGSKGYKLGIHADKDDALKKVVVTVEAVPVVVEKYFYDESIKGFLPKWVVNNRGINHLICMGGGEGSARTRADLYLNASGAVTETQHYFGFKERTAYYDYSSAQDIAELKSYGAKRLLELAGGESLQITQETRHKEAGDKTILINRDRGISTTATITKVVYKRKGGVESYDYEIGDV